MDNPSPIAPYIGCSELMAAFAKCEKQDVLEEALSKAYGLHDDFAEWVDKKVAEKIDAIEKAIEQRRMAI